jgi:hypothetical protein
MAQLLGSRASRSGLYVPNTDQDKKEEPKPPPPPAPVATGTAPGARPFPADPKNLAPIQKEIERVKAVNSGTRYINRLISSTGSPRSPTTRSDR